MERKKNKNVYLGRIIAIKQQRITKLGVLGISPKKRKGPIKTEEKEALIDHVEFGMSEYGYSQAKAMLVTAKYLRRSIKLVRRVVKEKLRLGEVFGDPHSRDTKSTFEKLSIEQKERIRSIIHEEMRKCQNKEVGAQYPTIDSIHTAIHQNSNADIVLPKWERTTTVKILEELGFVFLANSSIRYGLLVDNDFTVARRKYVCEELLRLEAEGYYLVFIDESYVNVGLSPTKKWHDTTIHTAKEAKDRGLTTGNIRSPGRGERLIIVGAGGREGWLRCDVIERTEGTGNDMNYKTNMDGARFEKFIDGIAEEATQQHEKVAFIFDNASYHNQYREDIPRSGWVVKRIKEFCELKGLEVISIGKRGPIKDDYMRAVDEYVERTDCKYKVDVILKKYGIKAVRLPPYHPGEKIHEI